MSFYKQMQQCLNEKDVTYHIVKYANLSIPPSKLRGYFGNKYADNIDYHNHVSASTLRYGYPLVQYRLKQNYNEIFTLIGPKQLFLQKSINGVVISNAEIMHYQEQIGVTDNQRQYLFKTPYIAINQSNYLKYIKSNDKKQLLKSIIVGNVLSLSKSLGIHITQMLDVQDVQLVQGVTKIKNVNMISFTGRFSINYNIPVNFSIGKHVSLGFGVV